MCGVLRWERSMSEVVLSESANCWRQIDWLEARGLEPPTSVSRKVGTSVSFHHPPLRLRECEVGLALQSRAVRVGPGNIGKQRIGG